MRGAGDKGRKITRDVTQIGQEADSMCLLNSTRKVGLSVRLFKSWTQVDLGMK